MNSTTERLVPIIEEGAKFRSWIDFRSALTNYESENNEFYTIKSGGVIKLKDSKNKCKYKKVIMVCKYGVQVHRSVAKCRKTKTYKLACVSYIHLELDRTKQFLEIISLNLEHSQHISTKENINYLPEKRRLDESQKKEVLKMAKLNVKTSKIQLSLQRSSGKKIKMKDLQNLIQKNREQDVNNLSKAIEKLVNNGAKTYLIQETCKKNGT